jgi:D-alanine-D-alanine ligase
LDHFIQAIERSLFTVSLTASVWKNKTEAQQILFIKELTDIRVGIGFPVIFKGDIVRHPEHLLHALNEHFVNSDESVLLENIAGEEFILFEKFVHGKEFSCIVVQDDAGVPIALPPTEIIKGEELFDYRSKYLPGMTRKVTPIGLPEVDVERIRKSCELLFKALYFNVYARIDGFITSSGEIFLNDPNTTSGMLPSSFFFHQAAEIGLNPSQFLTYIIRTSLSERIKSGKSVLKSQKLLAHLDHAIIKSGSNLSTKLRVGVIMGGYSSERHISVESGRNIYEKLASSTKYLPIPIFLTGSDEAFELFQLPVNILLKDNADDIKEKVLSHKSNSILEHIRTECASITNKYASNVTFKAEKIEFDQLAERVDAVFIALHGRPGEDGALQKELEKFQIPYNGSGIESSSTTINKYLTNEILAAHGIHVARHIIVEKEEWVKDPNSLFNRIEKDFSYPFIAKPFDDGCSSAVKKIKSRDNLLAYCKLAFRETLAYDLPTAERLNMRFHEEFPKKQSFMIEVLIDKEDSDHFLEVTGGMVTHVDEDGKLRYEMFEPSETLASGEVLSLEEKFLAGEGQNLTPARYGSTPEENQRISHIVQLELQKVCEILNVEGYCRIDAFVKIWNTGEVEVVIIEVNSLPGMTPATCIFHQCALKNYKPYEFIDAILTYGIHKNNQLSHV